MAKLETYNGHYLWHYIPSFPAAVVFIALFGLLTAGHAFKLVRHRTWFCIPFVVGGVFETVGYVGRALAHDKTGKLIPYVLQSTLLLLAPILFAASLYMTLSRVIRAVGGQSCSMIPTRWLTTIFVFGDVFSFIVQASGAGLRVQAGEPNSKINPNLGSHVITGGLVFQIIIFAVFILAIVKFKSNFSKHQAAKATAEIPWTQSLWMLYLTSGLIMVRNVFRVVEYAMGTDGYLLSHEWPTYVFDAPLMTLTMVAFFWWYPGQLQGRVSPGSDTEMASAESSQRMG
ncbi:RTA1 like protein-domain-containing protein [Dactylonectria macrodidyma]|uniref:RTA1 like protein-domain-containing protein n=1 Tax=Dactylonectria macrodidyma TaxID=307937 RepID=A0A9P9DHB9_9HYPO|nr:RTA1 like protein-domain-containing protein [Dactylonectria macrodidyma]